MARPIKETPIIKGKDAYNFKKQEEEKMNDHFFRQKEKSKVKAAYEKMKNFKDRNGSF